MQQLTIPVANAANLLANGYTTIEVWAAADHGEVYSEITASTPMPATLTSADASTTFDMGGRTLKFVIDGGAEQVVTFDPLLHYWTPLQVATRINEVVPGLASVVGSAVVLTSPTTGRTSSLLITYSDSPNLGWSPNDRNVGLAARVALSSLVVIYTFTDNDGTKLNLYKWRFSTDGVNPTEFSPYTSGMPPPVPGVQISIGTATFVDAAGRPLRRKVVVVSESPPSSVFSVVAGSFAPLTIESDDNGFLQVPLVQGTQVRIGFEGTNFVRQITVPATATFDLMAALSAAQDPFSPQTVPPLLVRRNI